MKNILYIIKRIGGKFFEDSCFIRASGLAYSTILAMVPFITIIYAFGGFDTLGRTIESELLKAIIPAQHEAVSQALNAFTRNSLATGTLGTIFFLLTSIFLINTIARNFDAIWGVSSSTNFFRKYATYTAILVFGSLLLGVSNSISDSIENYILSIGISEIDSFREVLSLAFPFVITLIIFFGMLTIIPSSKVKLKAAAVGAITSAILFEIIKIVFKYWVVNSVKISLIYGSIAVIPVFLVGLYLFWLIILIGVEITYFIQNDHNLIYGSLEQLNMEEKIYLGIELYLQVAKSYLYRTGGISDKELEGELESSPLIINSIISLFLEDNLILNINSKTGGYIPGKSLDRVKLSDIVDTIYGGKSRINSGSKISKLNSTSFTEGGYNSLEQLSILDIIKKDEVKKNEK